MVRRESSATALLILLLLPASAHAAPRPVLSVQDERAITCDQWNLRGAALDAARELGAKVIRVNLIEWLPCAPSTTAAAAIANAGLRPQLTLLGSPRWIKQQVLANRALVSTYAVWNEPDLSVWRCCTAPFLAPDRMYLVNPAPYRRTYVRSYRLIKRLDPGARVLFGELSPHGIGTTSTRGLRWVEQVLKPGRPLRADGIAIHPYTWFWSSHVDAAYLRQLVAFKRVVKSYGRRRMLIRPGTRRRSVPIYNTEYGQSRADGLDGDGAATAKAYSYARRLGFRQQNQYMIFPAFEQDHSLGRWNTAATDNECRPSPMYFALRKAATGRAGNSSGVAWPNCPDPIPGVTRPLPDGYGTPGYTGPGAPTTRNGF